MKEPAGQPGIVTRALRSSVEMTVDFAARFRDHQEREAQLHVVEDVPYAPGGSADHLLDVIRLKGSTGVQPALLYVHGGGFAMCSKRTHRYFAFQYAKLGFTVFNINYRLMPEHRFPAAAHDTMTAFQWVLDHAHLYGGDVSNIVLAGESAGGNLTLGLAVAACYGDIADPLAASIFERNPTIGAILPACGLLQVSNAARFWRDKPRFSRIAKGFFNAIERDYLPSALEGPGKPDLADPLCVVENRAPDRPLPPTFVYCGTKDFVYPDSARLAKALREQGATCEFHSYEDMDHAFHALPWSHEGKRCWRQQARFLQQRIDGLFARKADDEGYIVSSEDRQLRKSA